MFHLYFGAFDIMLYLGGLYFSLVLSKAICDDLEQTKVAQTVAPATTVDSTRPVVTVPKRKSVEEQSVRVSVRG